ncbi:MAG: phosphate acyltransferase PlsX [Myxococcota bacterium]
MVQGGAQTEQPTGNGASPESPWIAYDAMGLDHGPAMAVAGALEGVRKHGVHVIMVGQEDVLKEELRKQGGSSLLGQTIRIQHASEVATMEDKPSEAIRKKKDSSMRVAYDLVKAGEAAGVVSAGNSGVSLGLALLVLGRIRGVLRPAIASLIPRPNEKVGGHTVLLDSGANTVVAPGHLVQWAFLGDVYARVVRGMPNPRVGILSNGEEDSKGTDATRAANEALKSVRHGLNYMGYCEGRDVTTGGVDVVVTDGFTGNVVLKTIEGVGRAVKEGLENHFRQSLLTKMQYLLVANVFQRIRKAADYRNIGGAPMLGVKGVSIVAHGGSDAVALGHALRVARLHVNVRINDAVARAVEEHDRLFPEAKKLTQAHMDRLSAVSAGGKAEDASAPSAS